MRLCCYIDSTAIGGTEQVLAGLLSGLPKHYEVTVVGVSDDIARWVTRSRPDTEVVVLPRVKNKWDLRGIIRHLRAFRRLRPDLVHISLGQLWDGQYGMLAAAACKAPIVAIVHAVFPPTNKLQVQLFRLAASRVSVFAGVSQSVCSAAESELGLAAGQVRVLWNGISDQPGCDEAPQRPTGGFVIGAVGRLHEEKGFDVLLQAMAMLPEARLVIIGDGDQRPALVDQAHGLGLDGRVSFAGWCEPPWTARWAFDVVAVPSRVEGFGLVAVEAQLAGIPVVASSVGGLPEAIDPGRSGLLVPPDNPVALAEALARLAADPTLGEDLGRAGSELARKKFTLTAMVGRYEALFQEVIQARQPGTGAAR